MGAEEQALTQSLRTHVEQLAGEIGERNIFRPQALQAAASYIERQWEQQGYVVERLAYEVSGVAGYYARCRSDRHLCVGLSCNSCTTCTGERDCKTRSLNISRVINPRECRGFSHTGK